MGGVSPNLAKGNPPRDNPPSDRVDWAEMQPAPVVVGQATPPATPTRAAVARAAVGAVARVAIVQLGAPPDKLRLSDEAVPVVWLVPQPHGRFSDSAIASPLASRHVVAVLEARTSTLPLSEVLGLRDSEPDNPANERVEALDWETAPTPTPVVVDDGSVSAAAPCAAPPVEVVPSRSFNTTPEVVVAAVSLLICSAPRVVLSPDEVRSRLDPLKPGIVDWPSSALTTEIPPLVCPASL